jgi:hypothetical protein
MLYLCIYKKEQKRCFASRKRGFDPTLGEAYSGVGSLPPKETIDNRNRQSVTPYSAKPSLGVLWLAPRNHWISNILSFFGPFVPVLQKGNLSQVDVQIAVQE